MPPRRSWLLAALLLALAACSRYTSSTSHPQSPATATPPVAPPTATSAPAAPASPGSTPASQSGATPTGHAPAATPTISATATPTPVETAVPVTAPRAHVSIPRLPPDAPPQILSVAVSETTVHSGDTVSGTVLTTSNVASVEVRIAAYGMGLAKTGVGRFAITYPVNLPFFVRGTFAMRVIARNTRGESTETTIPITVR